MNVDHFPDPIPVRDFSVLPSVAMPIVGFHLRIAEPPAQRLQALEVVLNLEEGCRPFALRQVLKQLGVPRRALLGLDPNDAPDELIIQQEIIGARRELNQAVGHSDILSGASCRSTLS